MTHFLQTVLESDEPLLSHGLKELEKSTGNSGIDTRLIADIFEKSHSVMRELGLDTKDTTGHELYHALISAVESNNIESLLQDRDYVLYIIDKQIISFNLIDVIENFHHQLGYDQQSISHGQRSLRGEIVGRYLNHARTNDVTTLGIATTIGLLTDNHT